MSQTLCPGELPTGADTPRLASTFIETKQPLALLSGLAGPWLMTQRQQKTRQGTEEGKSAIDTGLPSPFEKLGETENQSCDSKVCVCVAGEGRA